MPLLRPEPPRRDGAGPEPSPSPGPRPGSLKPGHLGQAVQFLTVAAFAALMMSAPQPRDAAPEEPPSRRIRYEVKQEEWPTRPTLRQIQDRYGGNLAAMQTANERGTCADPDAPIDYGETIYIDFSSDARRCVSSRSEPPSD